MPILTLALAARHNSYFEDMVDDVWIEILSTLSVNDILRLRRTCKHLSALSTLRCIWLRKFCTEVLAEHLPIPGPYTPLRSMSASDLEWRTRRALTLKSRWSAPSANDMLRHERILPSAHFDQVVLMPGGRQLLAVQESSIACLSIPEQPGCVFGPELLGKWSFPHNTPCRVMRDTSTVDVIVVSSISEPHSAIVLSVGFEPVFHEERRYNQLPGPVVGIHDQLIFVHILPSDENDGGIQVMNWHSASSGAVFIPCYLDLFDGFVQVTCFADHILVVWETCVTVIPYPDMPPPSQLVSPPRMQNFRFKTPVANPIAFTSCQTIIPNTLGFEANSRISAMEDTLTIVAKSRDDPAQMTQVMFTPNFSDSSEDLSEPWDDRFPYKLSTVSQCYTPTTKTPESLNAVCLGSSGRGVWVTGNEVRQCAPSVVCMPPFDFRLTPVFEPTSASFVLDESEPASVDFDEGMGRVVAALVRGGLVVLDLD